MSEIGQWGNNVPLKHKSNCRDSQNEGWEKRSQTEGKEKDTERVIGYRRGRER